MKQSNFELDNRNVVITGGASGIGFAFARALGARGCRVMIAEPDQSRLEAAVGVLEEQGIDATYCVCDVAQLTQVEELAEAAWNAFGRVDMIFNNAGISVGQNTIVDTSVEDLRAIFDVNFFLSS